MCIHGEVVAASSCARVERQKQAVAIGNKEIVLSSAIRVKVRVLAVKIRAQHEPNHFGKARHSVCIPGRFKRQQHHVRVDAVAGES